MKIGTAHTYGRIPYWPHNGHTAVVSLITELEDGTANVTWSCDCNESWTVATGVDHSEEAPEG